MRDAKRALAAQWPQMVEHELPRLILIVTDGPPFTLGRCGLGLLRPADIADHHQHGFGRSQCRFLGSRRLAVNGSRLAEIGYTKNNVIAGAGGLELRQ